MNRAVYDALSPLVPPWLNVNSPQWDRAQRRPDWRNHVPEEIQAIWSDLSTEARFCVVAMAHERAAQEARD